MSITAKLNSRSDRTARHAVLDLLAIIFSNTGGLDIRTVERSIELSCSGNSGVWDRTIPEKRARFALDHVGMVCLATLVNSEFIDAMYSAVQIEISIDKLPAGEAEEYRRSLLTEVRDPSEPELILDLSTFSGITYRNLCRVISKSFEMVSEYSYDVEEYLKKLSEDERQKRSYVFSNFFYLIRALSHNDIFYNWFFEVVGIIEDRIKE